MDFRGSGLWFQIAAGIAVGVVTGAVVLNGLWWLQLHLVVDPALRELMRTGSGTVQVPQVTPQRVQVPTAPGCRSGEMPGQVNGESVCVGRSSGTVRKLGD